LSDTNLCRHPVSAAIGKPCISFFAHQEPSGRLHCSWVSGVCDEPSGAGCSTFGPFDDAGIMMLQRFMNLLVDFESRCGSLVGEPQLPGFQDHLE